MPINIAQPKAYEPKLSSVERRKLEELAAQANREIQPTPPSNPHHWIPQHALQQAVAATDLRPRLPSLEKFKVADIDEAVHFLLCHFIDKGNDHLLTQEEIYIQMKDLLKRHEENAIKASGKESSYKFTDKVVSLLQRAVESFGLIISGLIASCAMGNIPIGVAAVAIGSFLLIETIFENPIKKELALVLKKMAGETEELWLERINYFASAAAIAVGLGCGAHQAIEIAKQVSVAALAAARAVTKTKTESAKKEYLQHDALVDLVKGLLNKVTDAVKGDTERLRHFLQLAAAVHKNRFDAAANILRG